MTPKDYYQDRDVLISAIAVVACIALTTLTIVISHLIWGRG
jgi:hypothetical protein